ncbi:MerR family transcriptional regulator [Planococcus lenghuensis]|uniref:HTH merR-type domain-containing protein n=1 Tax=Planococcus lenghuensis TaxID=2213202 RepID=A0A1Q2KW70_9BACL|nr:MerR family transcriptional regulator [Planococcus lenghuensis]AQQ52364.1 hypothetical protein B0X71_04045 [Planococcus lenghuensis]
MDHINQHTSYNITQAAELTSLSKQVIRKWEDRYGIISPERLENGYRIYNQDEIDTLLNMKKLITQGYSVKQAALFLKEQQHTAEPVPVAQLVQPGQPDTMQQYLYLLLEEGRLAHEMQMTRILQQAYHSCSLQEFLDELIIPFLKEVGQRWSDGRWGEYQEALASLAVRDFLVQLRRNFQVSDQAPIMLGACLPHERHEIPVHIIALKFMIRGWKTVVLGPSPAPNAIQATVRQLLPQKVILSSVTGLPFKGDTRLLEELDDFAATHPHIDFYLGGPGAVQFAEGKELKAIRITVDAEAAF